MTRLLNHIERGPLHRLFPASDVGMLKANAQRLSRLPDISGIRRHYSLSLLWLFLTPDLFVAEKLYSDFSNCLLVSPLYCERRKANTFPLCFVTLSAGKCCKRHNTRLLDYGNLQTLASRPRQWPAQSFNSDDAIQNSMSSLY
jgi:hypothetical protein